MLESNTKGKSNESSNPGGAEMQNLLHQHQSSNISQPAGREADKHAPEVVSSQESASAATNSMQVPLAGKNRHSSSQIQLPVSQSSAARNGSQGSSSPSIQLAQEESKNQQSQPLSSRQAPQLKANQSPMLTKAGDQSIAQSPVVKDFTFTENDPSVFLELPQKNQQTASQAAAPASPAGGSTRAHVLATPSQNQVLLARPASTGAALVQDKKEVGVDESLEQREKRSLPGRQTALSEKPGATSGMLSTPNLNSTEKRSTIVDQSRGSKQKSKGGGLLSCFFCCGPKSNSSLQNGRRSDAPIQLTTKSLMKKSSLDPSGKSLRSIQNEEASKKDPTGKLSQVAKVSSASGQSQGSFRDNEASSSAQANERSAKSKKSVAEPNSKCPVQVELDEIKVVMPTENSRPSLLAQRGANQGSDGSGFDDYNEDDDVIEEENKSPVSIQQTNSLTRAGIQKNNFGLTRQVSVTKQKPSVLGMDRTGVLGSGLEIRTEETVTRQIDPKLAKSPSIRDVSSAFNQMNPAGSMVSVAKDSNALEGKEGVDAGFFSGRPTQPEHGHQLTPRSGSQEGSSGKGTGHGFNSQHYASAKVHSNGGALHGSDRVQIAISSDNNQFDHQQELKDMHLQRVEDHTFGNHNSKRSLLEQEDIFKGSEAVNGLAVGQENAIIRPSGSKTSLKQIEDVAPSSSANEDLISATNVQPNSSTAMQSSFTGPQKQDSQQQTQSVLIDVSVSQSSQPMNLSKVAGHNGNFVNASKVQPVSTKSRPTPQMATVAQLNNTGIKMRSHDTGHHHAGQLNQLGAANGGKNPRWQQLDQQHTQLKRQFRDSKLRQQNAARRLNKIQKDLSNIESDNQELHLILTQLLQRKLLMQSSPEEQ